MNKKILLTTIIAIIAVGVTSAYAVIDLKADKTVTGDLAVTGDLTGPTITALTTSIASAGGICPPQNVVHYDKIIFHPKLILADCGVPSGNPTELLTHTQFISTNYDIKVLDDPDSVAFLEGKVADFLNNLNYCTPGGTAGPFKKDFGSSAKHTDIPRTWNVRWI